VTFDEALPVDAAALSKRLHGVLATPLADDIEKRGVKANPAVSDDLAGLCRLSPEGVGTVFPYFYVYATPRTIVGVLQTIPAKKVK
jgi:hypothetical protein